MEASSETEVLCGTMASRCDLCIKTRARLEQNAANEHSNMIIRAGSAIDIPEICPRHTIAQAMGTTYYDHRYSGDYPMGVFQWKWSNVPHRYRKRSDKNGSFGLANIILSSTSEFKPGMHLVHHCAHKECKEFASCAASTAGVMGAPLHLFGIDSGIATRNVPQSRTAAESADMNALALKVHAAAEAGPSPPSPPWPKKRKTPEEDGRIGRRLNAKEIAEMKMEGELHLAKCKKYDKDQKSKNDKKSKKAKKPKKIKNAAKDTNNAKNKNTAKGNCRGIMCVPGKVFPVKGKLWGQEFRVAAKDSNTIADVKYKIFDKTGVRTTAFRILFAGRALADDKTLAFYNIPDEAKLAYQDNLFPADRIR